jgi:hypothetical protein
MPMSMSKLARAVVLVAMLAPMNLAGLVAVAQAHTGNDPPSARHRALGRVEFRATADHGVASQEQLSADATVRRLLARERSSIPNGAPGHTAADAAHPRLLLAEERSTLLNLPNDTSTQAQATDTRAALAQERYYSTWGYGEASTPAPAEPSGQPTWLVIALAALAAVLALVAGIAVLAAHRATRSQHAGQTA